MYALNAKDKKITTYIQRECSFKTQLQFLFPRKWFSVETTERNSRKKEKRADEKNYKIQNTRRERKRKKRIEKIRRLLALIKKRLFVVP